MVRVVSDLQNNKRTKQKTYQWDGRIFLKIRESKKIDLWEESIFWFCCFVNPTPEHPSWECVHFFNLVKKLYLTLSPCKTLYRPSLEKQLRQLWHKIDYPSIPLCKKSADENAFQDTAGTSKHNNGTTNSALNEWSKTKTYILEIRRKK